VSSRDRLVSTGDDTAPDCSCEVKVVCVDEPSFTADDAPSTELDAEPPEPPSTASAPVPSLDDPEASPVDFPSVGVGSGDGAASVLVADESVSVVAVCGSDVVWATSSTGGGGSLTVSTGSVTEPCVAVTVSDVSCVMAPAVSAVVSVEAGGTVACVSISGSLNVPSPCPYGIGPSPGDAASRMCPQRGFRNDDVGNLHVVPISLRAFP
jgi:hypothetical protein